MASYNDPLRVYKTAAGIGSLTSWTSNPSSWTFNPYRGITWVTGTTIIDEMLDRYPTKTEVNVNELLGNINRLLASIKACKGSK